MVDLSHVSIQKIDPYYAVYHFLYHFLYHFHFQKFKICLIELERWHIAIIESMIKQVNVSKEEPGLNSLTKLIW